MTRPTQTLGAILARRRVIRGLDGLVSGHPPRLRGHRRSRGVPRVRCPEHGVRQVALAWARPGSGFTLLFEALVMAMVKEMPVQAVASLIGEHETRVWRVVHHYVDEARAAQYLSRVERVGVDEASSRRGQDYVSAFADLDRPRAGLCHRGAQRIGASGHAMGGRGHRPAQRAVRADQTAQTP